MTIKQHFASESDMQAFAAQMARAITDGAVIYLNGALGAGKTTFTRGFLRGLGFNDKVKSPTYTLVEPYDFADRQIFHFDFYRINNVSELQQIGIEEYFSSSSICLIEWPEKGVPLVPQADLVCDIEFANEGRVITVTANSARGMEALQRLQR